MKADDPTFMRIHRLAYVVRSVTALLATVPLLAQQLAWRELAPHAVPDCQLVFDLDRSRFVAHAERTLEWDGIDWRIRATPTTPPARQAFGLAYDPTRHRTVLFGGTNSTTLLADLWEYDGTDWTQRPFPLGPGPRQASALAFDPSLGGLLLFGGRAGSPLADLWLWDGATWTPLPILGPGPRGRAAMAFHANSQAMVLYGGDVGSNETWTLQAGTWTQRQPATQPPAKSMHRLCADLASGLVHMFGDDDPLLWSWNGTDWTPGQGGPPRRERFGLAADASGNTLLFAGTHRLPVSGLPIVLTRGAGDTWRHDAQGWHLVRPTPQLLVDVNLAYDLQRDRVVLSGVASDNQATQPIREWDGQRWHEIPGSQLPWSMGSRLCHDWIRGRTLRFGGLVQTAAFFGVIQDTREWDGNGWAMHTVPGPAARWGHAMAFDALRGGIVLFGGSALGAMMADTWQWNGTAWTQLASSGPPPRMLHAMTHDLLRDRVVLFGGTGSSSLVNDTWEWDGATWLLSQPPTAPTGRTHHSLHWDALRQRTILIAGRGQSGTTLREEWRWDGALWTAAGTAVPVDLTSSADAALPWRHGQWVRFAGAGLWHGAAAVARTVTAGGGCGPLRHRLLAFGDPVLGDATFAVDVRSDAGQQPFLLGLGAGQTTVPLPGGCTLHLPAIDVGVFAVSTASGFGSLPLPVPPLASLLGVTATLQAAWLDAAMPLGIALSNAIVATIGN